MARGRKDKRKREERAHVLKDNVAKLAALRERETARHGWQTRVAEALTRFSGSMAFVYLHAGWFGCWMIVNSGWLGASAFDPPPFGLLTLIVSLEAIFLSTFVLISQNRAESVHTQRSELDLQINLLAERETTRILQMLDAIACHLNVKVPAAEDLRELESVVSVDAVLEELQRVDPTHPQCP